MSRAWLGAALAADGLLTSERVSATFCAASSELQMSWQDVDTFSLGSGFSGVTDKVPVAMPPGRGMVAANLDLRVLELLTAR